jgi:hypothetical protein
MLCAYAFVPKFCEIADDKITKESLLEDAKKILGDKIRSYEDIDVKKMYLAQKVVPDMRYRIFFENHDGSIQKKIHLISSYAPGKNPRIIPIDRRNPDLGFMRATTINTTVLDDSGHPYIGGTGTLLEQVYNKRRKSA